jgi:hypothetical protein
MKAKIDFFLNFEKKNQEEQDISHDKEISRTYFFITRYFFTNILQNIN